MKITVRIALMVLLSSLAITVPAIAQELVAKVGNVPVTVYDYNRHIQKRVPLNSSFHGGIKPESLQRIKKEAMEDALNKAYQTQAAIAEEISVSQEKIGVKLQPFLDKYPTKADFLEASGGETYEMFKASLYRELLATEAVKVLVDDVIVVEEAEVEAYYKEHKQRFSKPMTFKASHILVRVDPSSNAETREKRRQWALELLERAKSGEDFYNLAYHNSDDQSRYVGGDLGYFHKGEVERSFEVALEQMEPGDVTGLVKTLHGYHILMLQEKQPPRQLSYEEMQPKIKDKIRKDKRTVLYDSWMSGLKEKYKVEHFSK